MGFTCFLVNHKTIGLEMLCRLETLKSEKGVGVIKWKAHHFLNALIVNACLQRTWDTCILYVKIVVLQTFWIFTDFIILNISKFKNRYAYFDIHVTCFLVKERLLRRHKASSDNFSSVIWLKYCRYGVKHYSINQSITFLSRKYTCMYRKKAQMRHIQDFFLLLL